MLRSLSGWQSVRLKVRFQIRLKHRDHLPNTGIRRQGQKPFRPSPYAGVVDHRSFALLPYSLVCHPIYSLQWLIIFGNFLIVPAIPLLVSLLTLAIAMRFKARYEEKALEEIFGSKYREYREKTSRFLPLRCCWKFTTNSIELDIYLIRMP